MITDPTEFAAAIAAAGLSKNRVCRRADRDYAVLSRWFAGRTQPSLTSLNRLNAALAELIAESAGASGGAA